MRRVSPSSRWVVVPTVLLTATLVTAVAWAGALPGGDRHPDRTAASAPAAPRGDPAAAPAPALRLHPLPPRGHRRPTATPTRPAPVPTATAAPTIPATATAPATRRAPTSTAAPAPTGFAAQVVALTNAQRAKAGCGALAGNGVLTAVAQSHSQDMATHGYFAHDSQDGRTPFDRMTAAGYRYSTAAENIAAGQRTPQDVVTAWMNSAGHRANILNCGLREIGVGYATASSSRYGGYWTQDFGTPR